MGLFGGRINSKPFICSGLCFGLVLIIPPVHATIPDGTYTGSVDGNYNGLVCPGGSAAAAFTGADATLTASGSTVTLDIAKPGIVNISGSGTQSGGNIILNYSFEVDGSALNSGIHTDTGVITPVIVSGNDVSLDFTMLNDIAGPCSSLTVDWNPFTVTLTASTGLIDPEVTSSSIITGADTENLDRAISSFIMPVQNRTRGFHLQTLRDNQGIVSTFNPTVIENGLMLEGTTGMNAGDTAVLYGAWTSYSYSDFENDFIRTRYDGDRHTVMAGVDVSPWERALFGVAIGWENTDFDTDFNLGEQDTDGFTVFPYFGGLLTDTWSVDFGFGYSTLDTEQFRTDPTTGTIVTSSPDADRWFGMLNLNGLTTYGNWIIGGRIGLMYARQDQEAFTESNGTTVAAFRSEIGQWNLGTDVSYSYGNFEPYARLTYENDFNQTKITFTAGQQPSNDDDNILIGAGVRYFNNDNISGYLEWYKRLGREDVDEDTFTISIRIEF